MEAELGIRAFELGLLYSRRHRDEDLALLHVLSRRDEDALDGARIDGGQSPAPFDAHERDTAGVLVHVEEDDVEDGRDDDRDDDAVRPREPARIEAKDVAFDALA